MKNILLIFPAFLICIFSMLPTYAQQMEWVKKIDQNSSNSDDIKIYAVAKDLNENLFVTGFFKGIVNFDPAGGAGGILTSFYLSWYSEDPFIAKYDASGNFLWAKRIISLQGLGRGNALAVDGSGNVYVSGSQYVTDLACFLTKYTSDGTQSYYYAMKGYESTGGEGSITLDASGNLYYFNRFTGTNVDLDPTAGTRLATSAGSGTYDAFIAKFTASTGAFLWAKTFGGTSFEETYNIETDGTYLYVCGGYSSVTDFDPDAGIQNRTPVGNYDIFVARYLCTTGAYNYAYSFGGSDNERGYNIKLDGNYLYFATQYTGTIDFDPNAATYNLTSASGGTSSSMALLRMDKSNLAVSWGYNVPFNTNRPSMAISGTTFLISGTVPTGTFDFNPGAGVNNITGTGWTGAVLSLNSDQSFNWVVKASEPASSSYYKSICADNTTGFYYATDFEVSVVVDPAGNSTSLTVGAWGGDAFFSHWKTCTPPTAASSASASPATICSGSSSSISLSGGSLGSNSTWQWYSGSCGGTSVGTGTSISVSPTSTTTYYVRAEGTCGTTACVSTTVTVNSAPANDNCANAINIGALPYTSAIMSNACATNDVPASTCDGPYKNIWWKVTGICGTMTANTCTGNTNFDSEIAVFTGACGSMTQVGCNDDACSLQSSVTWTATASTIYYISVGSYYSGGATGNIQLNVTSSPYTSSTAPASITGTPSACSGGSTTLSVSGGFLGTGASWKWYTGSCGGTAAGTGVSISASPTVPTTYFVRAEGTCNTTACVSVTVTLNARPLAVITGTSTVCLGNTSTLSAATSVAGSGSITGYQWWYDNGITNTAISGATSVTYSASLPGSYSVVITDSNGCASVTCP